MAREVSRLVFSGGGGLMSQVEINRRQVSTQAGPHGDRLAGYTDDVGGRD